MTQRTGVVEPPPLDSPTAGAATNAGGRRLPRGRSATSLTRASGLGLGVALMWFSLLVLIPLTAVLVQASEGGWSAYWDSLSSPQTLAALKLTVGQAILVTVVNIFMGTTIAWVLVRDHFPGKQVLEVVIDIPLALPTMSQGGAPQPLRPSSPLGVNWANTPVAVFFAFCSCTAVHRARLDSQFCLRSSPKWRKRPRRRARSARSSAG